MEKKFYITKTNANSGDIQYYDTIASAKKGKKVVLFTPNFIQSKAFTTKASAQRALENLIENYGEDADCLEVRSEKYCPAHSTSCYIYVISDSKYGALKAFNRLDMALIEMELNYCSLYAAQKKLYTVETITELLLGNSVKFNLNESVATIKRICLNSL